MLVTAFEVCYFRCRMGNDEKPLEDGVERKRCEKARSLCCETTCTT